MRATISYDDGTEFEVDDFEDWAIEVLQDPDADDADLVTLAEMVLDVAEGLIVDLDLEEDDHYRDGWDSVSTEETT